jgi:hypothetical protein
MRVQKSISLQEVTHLSSERTAFILASVEDMNLPNPVIRGNGFIKQYVRDHLILRTEAASNNVNDYGVNKSVQNLLVLRNAPSAINNN